MTETRETVWVECGRVIRPWGIRGELLVEWMRQECPVTCGAGSVYMHRDDGEYVPLGVCTSRSHGAHHVVRFEGYTSRNDAEKLRGATFFMPEGDLPDLPDGEYYSYQILGLDVYTTDGRYLGTVTKIFTAGDNDVYVVKGESGEVLIPAVAHVVVSIDIASKRMTIDAIDGLLNK